jgi:hypothetical protein
MLQRTLLLLGLPLTLAGATLLASCVNDPVYNTRQQAFGDDFSYPSGNEGTAYHRPGQPCVECHSKRGGASPVFAVAGTIFWGTCNIKKDADDKTRRERCDQTPVAGAEVRIIDKIDKAKPYCVKTNCAGNFSFPDTKVSFPFLVSVSKRSKTGELVAQASMSGHISRDGSCAGCHDNPQREESPGQVYLYAQEKDGKVGIPSDAREVMKRDAAEKCPDENFNPDCAE